MLKIHIPKSSVFVDNLGQYGGFIETPETDLCLEHSLVSISKWESKWEKPFISKDQHTAEELLDYIKCMTLTQNVDPLVYHAISNDKDMLKKIYAYIDAKMTATTFTNRNPNLPAHKTNGGKIITSEQIYYWMFQSQIPIQCEKWHLNRLLTLIRIYSVENGNGKKMSKSETLAQYKAINAARRAKHN